MAKKGDSFKQKLDRIFDDKSMEQVKQLLADKDIELDI